MGLLRDIGKAALLAGATALVSKGVEKLFEPAKPAPDPTPAPPVPPAHVPAKPRRGPRPRKGGRKR